MGCAALIVNQMNEVETILYSIKNCVYLTAFNDYQALMTKLKRSEDHSSAKGIQSTTNIFTEAQKTKILNDLQAHKTKIDEMLQRVPQIQRAIQAEDHEEWILGLDYGGVLTHYCKNSADNSIKLKMEGTLDNLPLFEQFAVLHEIDLYHTWAPLCLESKLIEKPAIGEFIGYVNMGMSVVARDMLLRAYGVDCLASHGKFLVIGQSELNYSGDKQIPFKPASWLQNRMECKEFRFVVDVITPSTSKVSIVTHINPNSAMPTRLLNFVMKNLAGIIISVYHKQVNIVATQYNCKHAERVRANPGFYSDWLLPGLRQFCDSKGWMQPSVHCLNIVGVRNAGTPTSIAQSNSATCSPKTSNRKVNKDRDSKEAKPTASYSNSSSSGSSYHIVCSDGSVTTALDDFEWDADEDYSTMPWFGV